MGGAAGAFANGWGNHEKAMVALRNFAERIGRRAARQGASAGDSAAGKHCCGGRAENCGCVGGDGGTIRVLPQREPGGLESREARNADCDSLWRHATVASGECAGRRTASVDVLFGRDNEWTVPSKWRRLHCVQQGYRRRGMVSAVSLRFEDERSDSADRWQGAQSDGPVVVERR